MVLPQGGWEKTARGGGLLIDEGDIHICLYVKKTDAKMVDITQAHFEP
jgi:hypothetical protein